MEQTTTLYVDGTFKSAPPLFAQVYVVLAEIYGAVIPVVYGLLPNKTRQTYSNFTRMLLEIAPNMQPTRILCDFEIAAVSAFRERFPNATICGCYFHLAQNMQKHLAQQGLRERYNNEADFALQAKMILALAFVPIPQINKAIDQLSKAIPDELQDLLNWFEDNYVGRPGRRGNARRPPIFAVEMWNLYDRVLQNVDRTNNHSEAANRRLQNELGMDHPTIWKFVEALKKIQKGRDLHLQQIIAGHGPQAKLRKYVQADERISRLVNDFYNRNILDFLRGISYNFEMSQN